MTSAALDRDYQWVTDRIAVGSAVSSPSHVRALVADGISHVLDCRLAPDSQALYLGTMIVYRRNGVADDGRPKPDEWFFGGIEFVAEALKRPWTRALVHCRFGMSRSPTMVYAILRTQGMPESEAKSRISGARAVARVTYPDDAERAARRWIAQRGRHRP